MTADVHAVAFVIHCPADAADRVCCFQHDGPNVGAAQQFKSRGQACGSGADDDSGTGVRLRVHWVLACKRSTGRTFEVGLPFLSLPG